MTLTATESRRWERERWKEKKPMPISFVIYLLSRIRNPFKASAEEIKLFIHLIWNLQVYSRPILLAVLLLFLNERQIVFSTYFNKVQD